MKKKEHIAWQKYATDAKKNLLQIMMTKKL